MPAKHSDRRENGIAAEWRETIYPWAAEKLIAKRSNKVAGVVRARNWGEAEWEFLEAPFCRWYLQMGRRPVSRMNPLCLWRGSPHFTQQTHTQRKGSDCMGTTASAPSCIASELHSNSNAGLVPVAGKSVEWGCREHWDVRGAGKAHPAGSFHFYLGKSRVAHVPCNVSAWKHLVTFPFWIE